jgi:predicted RNA-binding protein with PUA-like domain
MASQYWLFKSEPGTYSFDRLLKDGKTNWNDVRNFQARNFLKEVKKGDQAVIYHSGDDKSVVGIAECVREGYPDIEKEDGKEWVQIDIKPVAPLKAAVPLSLIKATPSLKDMLLIRHTRLSVMPITKAHFEILLKLAENAPIAAKPIKVKKKIAPKKGKA